MEKDIKVLANIVDNFYMPKLKEDIEKAATGFDKDILTNLYKEYEILINKYKN